MATASSAVQKLIQAGTKIVAVGRNYAAHAKELGNAVPKEPVLFLKPTSSYLGNGGTIEVPHPLDSLHHEVELAVVIGQKARDVPETTAMDYVGGYAVALDMTAREIQSSAKSAGLPWTVAKGQDTFTPISSVLPKSAVPDPHNLELWLTVHNHYSLLSYFFMAFVKASNLFFTGWINFKCVSLQVDGEIRQKGSTKDMIFMIPYLISHISSIMTLFEGDVILTGTPQGVGPVKVGQKITAGITGLLDVHFDIEKRRRPGSA
ncbi:putative acylpyruvase FAHD1 [Citrus sinensis]|uniref:Acylpyruvase FAHD1 n=1 Tax=Citrus sinensis TaxID=2711 RepID=A0ACB8IAU6_CITSI|nr:putative acylpyruvase FAHD1 [Citrus sinensis]